MFIFRYKLLIKSIMHKIAQKIPLLLAEVIKGHLWWCWGPQMPQSWRKQMGSTNFFWLLSYLTSNFGSWSKASSGMLVDLV